MESSRGAGEEQGRPESGSDVDKTIGVKTFSEMIGYDPAPLSVRHYDKDTTEPISFYFSSLEELLSWKPTAQDAFNVATTPLAPRLPALQSWRPRTLVCHDLMGGYLEDRFIQGSDPRHTYAFYHWQYIDIFVYFSHRMFTVPPVCWTNAAHRHGVSVLGTFITEWDGGGRTCESFLAGEDAAYLAVADQLVRMAHFYQFDGWLINIENLLSPTSVKNAPKFLRYLTDKLHAQVPGGLILWYDSVTEDGELKWQNELNEKNRIFFQACDGIFTNYNWTEEHLQRMMGEAGERQADVYVGVDVFARGEVVGGRYETNKSLQLIRKYGLSAAMFAPGWVYECLEKERFLQNQNKFWGLLEEHLPTHSLCTLPLSTSFCLGFGKRRFSYGKQVDAGTWCNLSAQEMQPLFVDNKSDTDDAQTGWVRTQSCPEDAWHGGGSLLMEGAIPAKYTDVSVRLFSFQMPAPPRLLLSMVYKLEGGSDVQVTLRLTTWDGPACLVENIVDLPELPAARTEPLTALAGTDPAYAQLSGEDCQQDYHGWTRRCYEVNLRDCLLKDLGILISRTSSNREEEIHFTCRLGEIKVIDSTSLSLPRPPVRDLSASQFLWRRGSLHSSQLYLSLTFRWSYPQDQARQFRIFCQGVTCHRAAALPDASQPHLIGLAHTNTYRVVDLAVPDPGPGTHHRLEFFVQPVTTDGFMAERVHWGRVDLVYGDRTHTLV